MKFSYSWLCDHLETDKNAVEIGDALTNIGLELESLTDYSSYSKFVVATIIDFHKHPNADRLNICTVDDGTKTYQVICGANNVKKGLKGIFAKDGMYIPGTQIYLKKGKIRGEISEGMLLSERELNLSDDHDGIIELSDNFENGTSAIDALKLNDPVFEIGITPNRGDCLGVRGIARDLSAKGIGKLKPLKYEKITKLDFESPISWNIENDNNSCEYVISRYFKDVKNKLSPEWLQKKLISLGLRPINALVDITNFITHDLGRPLHVFDADKVGKKLHMRLAKPNEKILALDNKEYTLDSNSTVIADNNNALAIAGIIGGESSGCTEDTQNVFLEVAIFEKDSVAKTGRTLGINSDARYRFERGLDKKMVIEGLNYASYLINKICGGSVSKNIDSGKLDTNERKIEYKFDYFEKVIGIKLEPKKQINILKDLKFQINQSNEKQCDLLVPSWRNDIENNIDVVEEVIRIYGYENIIESIPSPSNDEIVKINNSLINKKFKAIKKLKKSLISNGVSEIITFSFHSTKAHEILSGDVSLKISNAISDDQSFMRNSMIFNHLETADMNYKKGYKNIQIFEIGPIYNTSQSQENILSLLISSQENKNSIFKSEDLNFYSISNLVSILISSLNFDIKQFNISRSSSNIFHPGQSAELNMGKKLIARYGKVHPLIMGEFPKLKNSYVIELFFENLPIDSISRTNSSNILDSQFQFSEKDFSFIFEKEQNLFEVQRYVSGIDKNLIKNVEFFDLYESKDLGENSKSVTFRVTIQSKDKTLDEKDLEQIHNNILEKVSNKFKANIRT